MSNRILVTGKTGCRVYTALTNTGADVRAASRNSPIPFDWYDEHTWPQALAGISKVYISFQPDLAVPGAVDIINCFIQSCRIAGIQHLVLLSGRGEPEAEACEEIVIQSGMDWTIVRCSFFMQNFSEGFWTDGIINGELVLPEVVTREAFVDADDIAAVVVEAFITDRHKGKVYELSGPELLSFNEAVARIADASGRDIQLKQVPLETYIIVLKEHQVPEEIIALIGYLFTTTLDGRNASVKEDINEVLGRPAGSFDKYVQKTLAAGLWLKH
ncbi:NmrA family NAD(P)-binding protein [Niabella yanshanensis]|uniref:NmrA family NAD(P)-binding protein n=1 Tax=Niabella yanshanensis TaxID=577386 RepID=A0ABZ0W9G7_9BACT|nr:NmrA family NAD(P)-binding protein [Niabella yanshanensis]WQD39164.1 NmrA family NAD(P)-binding protein [Niabella yanshanensis]